MTESGEKTEDYREITIYWAKRLIHNLTDLLLDRHNPEFVDNKDCFNFLTNPRNNFGFKDFETNTMTLGYPKKTDKSKILIYAHSGITIRKGNPKWGAEEGKLYFVIKHGKRINN